MENSSRQLKMVKHARESVSSGRSNRSCGFKPERAVRLLAASTLIKCTIASGHPANSAKAKRSPELGVVVERVRNA